MPRAKVDGPHLLCPPLQLRQCALSQLFCRIPIHAHLDGNRNVFCYFLPEGNACVGKCSMLVTITAVICTGRTISFRTAIF